MTQKNHCIRQKHGHKKNDRNKKKRIIVFVVCLAIVIIAAVAAIFLSSSQEDIKQEENNKEKNTYELNPHIEEQETINADYEQCLAAAVITCISMDRPDFEIVEVYIATETTTDHKMDSQGVYVIYQSEGETLCIKAEPLEQGRSGESGTKDTYAEIIGYASYNEVSSEEIDTSVWYKADMSEMNALIEQLGRVVLYEN